MTIMDLIMDILGTAAFWGALWCTALLLRPVIIHYTVQIDRPGGGDGGGRRPAGLPRVGRGPPAFPRRSPQFGLRRW